MSVLLLRASSSVSSGESAGRRREGGSRAVLSEHQDGQQQQGDPQRTHAALHGATGTVCSSILYIYCMFTLHVLYKLPS